MRSIKKSDMRYSKRVRSRAAWEKTVAERDAIEDAEEKKKEAEEAKKKGGFMGSLAGLKVKKKMKQK